MVVISHSAKIAAGVIDLVKQMAPNIPIFPAGGTSDGRIGTEMDLIMGAMDQANQGDGVILLVDLGSAVMSAQLAMEMLPDVQPAAIANGPIVEGAVVGGVEAEIGGTFEKVLEVIENAGQMVKVKD
jgi:PTS hybrid protein